MAWAFDFVDFFAGNIIIFMLFRLVFLTIGSAEMYKGLKKPKDTDAEISYKPTVFQEATMNLMAFGLVIFCFILILYFDYWGRTRVHPFPDFWWMLIIIDAALGLFILTAYAIPKRVDIGKDGIYHLGQTTTWEDVIDYGINDNRGILKIKHYTHIFKFTYPTETVVPLPENKEELRKYMEKMVEGKDEKRKGRKRRMPAKKDNEKADEPDEEPEGKKGTGKKKGSAAKKKGPAKSSKKKA